MISSFHFIRPEWLWGFIPVVLLGIGLLRRQHKQRQAGALIAPHLSAHLMVMPQQKNQFRPIHILMLSWLVAVIALAGPSWKKQPNPFAQDEAGLYVLLNVSGSMLATDIAPNRLERAKHKLDDLLARRTGAPTGLIVYSGTAHLVMPLTTDARIIQEMVEGLVPESMPSEGKNLKAALTLADRMYEKAGRSGSILVMTDDPMPAPATQPYQTLFFGSALPAEADSNWTLLTVDESDVERLLRRADRQVQTVLSEQQGERWSDAGYYGVFLLVLATLIPFRKGWVVE